MLCFGGVSAREAPADLALTLDAFARKRKFVPEFTALLAEEARAKVPAAHTVVITQDFRCLNHLN